MHVSATRSCSTRQPIRTSEPIPSPASRGCRAAGPIPERHCNDHDEDRTMNAPTNIHRDCCSSEACAAGARNNYYPGKRLTADSFRVEQAYQIERRRLLNRAIHGWGVVYGYGVSIQAPDTRVRMPSPGALQLLPGLALDRCGRELLQVSAVNVAIDEI